MTDTERLQEARQFAEKTGNDDLADRLDEQLADGREALKTVVELRNLVEQSEENGLGDDPAVEALREEADALAAEHGLVESPSPREQLAAEYGLDGDAVDRLHEDDRDRLLANLRAVEEVEENRSARSGATLVDHEIAARREKVERLLDHNEVQAAALAGGDVDDAADSVSAFLAGLGDEEDR